VTELLQNKRFFWGVLGICILAGLAPVWIAAHQPGVDFPQHEFLIHVLRSVGDPASIYHDVYRAKPGLTYVTFYYFIRWISAIFGEERGLRIWMGLVLGAIPISMALVLRQLGRSVWLALLAIPLLYTDNYYWGLIAFISSIPLTLFVLAFLLETLQSDLHHRGPAFALGVSLVLLQLTHAAGMIYPALAVPALLLTTPSDGARRKRALLALLPGVALFLLWLFAGVGQGRKLGAADQPWVASAPLLDARNFVFTPLQQKQQQLIPLLANGFWSYADEPPIHWFLGVVAVTVFLGVFASGRWSKPSLAAVRPYLLFALALGCFFGLPMDIKGYMYQIYPRYSQVSALMLIPMLRLPRAPFDKLFVAAGAGLAIYSGVVLGGLFQRFDQEAQEFDPVAAAIAPQSRIMHLVTNSGSGVATHAVYLHYAALAALRSNSIPSFSLALDPSFPVGYLPGRQPPASPWEWHPEKFDWESIASHYDYYLLRGGSVRLFGQHANDLQLVTQNDRWLLYRNLAKAPEAEQSVAP
jgi:hypothetical protein